MIVNVYKEWVKLNENVLDVGCGNGIVSEYLEKGLGVKIRGCDIDNYLITKINFSKMKHPSKLPFKKNSFDSVMLNDVLHHTTKINQNKLLKEALRVGKKVLIFEIEPTLVSKVCDILINKIHYGSLKVPLTFRKIKDWEKLFRKMNFKYTSKQLRKPLLYPFKHTAFCVSSINSLKG
ncbi:MAG: class I SAM-dependent methyltransferase [Candidatus Hodarchaeota archaeon]